MTSHRDDGKRFVVRADEKLTAFVQLESAISAMRRRLAGKKEAGSESLPSQLGGFNNILRQLSTSSGSNDDDGGGANNGAHCTSSTSAQNSSRSTDKAGSIRMDNNRSRKPGSRFRWKSEHQNAAPE